MRTSVQSFSFGHCLERLRPVSCHWELRAARNNHPCYFSMHKPLMQKQVHRIS